MRSIHILSAVLAAALASAAPAATIASSDFSTGDQGWTSGELASVNGTGALAYNAAAQTVSTGDNFGFVAFIAPTAYLGNQSAAFGGTISFDLSDVVNDAVNYTPLSLISGATVAYANPVVPPSTTGLTSYSVTLTGANFYFGDPYDPNGGTALTDAQLLAILGSLDRLAIQADWATGRDFSTLDNVVLASTGPAAVPEPAAWMTMIAGFGLVGATLRRRRAAVAFA